VFQHEIIIPWMDFIIFHDGLPCIKVGLFLMEDYYIYGPL
jgi:hypothetical protein